MSLMVSRGSGPLGGLGMLLGIGGALTGNPWLTAAGMGANALSGGGTGGTTSQGGVDVLGQIAEQMGWKNPASGSVASQNPDISNSDLDKWYRAYMSSGYYGY